MKNTYFGMPDYWKSPRHRWHCEICGAEGWQSMETRSVIPQHDTTSGKPCKIAASARPAWVETDTETAYGKTSRISRSLRVF